MEKNKAFAFLYTLGIIFIIWSHCGEPIPLFQNWMPYGAFHVQLFVFCSGYFYKSDNETEIKKYIIKKIRTLLFPLFLWNGVYGIFLTLLNKMGFEFVFEPLNFHSLFISPIIHGHQYGFNLGGWFVIPLFMAEITNVVIMRMLAKTSVLRTMILVSYVTLGVIVLYWSKSFYDGAYTYQLPVLRFLYFLTFLGIGILYKQYESIFLKVKNANYFTVIFLIQIIILLKYSYIPQFGVSGMIVKFDQPYVLLITPLIGIAFWVRIAYIIQPLICNNKIVDSISDNTFSIMINHFFGFFVVNMIYAFLYKVGICYFNNFDMLELKKHRLCVFD